jgi:dolichol-phosphate mannosyltransferase
MDSMNPPMRTTADARPLARAHDAGHGPAPLLSIVVPTRNEEGNVVPLVAALERVMPTVGVEIIFVDDSDDGTPEAVLAVARTSSREVRLVHRVDKARTGGLGGAVVDGIRRARGTWVCVMDGDLQHPPEIVERLLERAQAGNAEIVVASRFCDHGGTGSFARSRRVLSSASSCAAHAMFPRRLRRVTDPMSGFFLVRRDALNLAKLKPRGFKILLEILVQTPGLRRAEVPFVFGERHHGESKAGLREGARYLRQLWGLRCSPITGPMGRFGLVGASGLIVNTLALAVLAGALGVHYLLAAILATQASTSWNFLLTEGWVFRGRAGRHRPLHRAGIFFAINNVALAARVPLLYVLTTGAGINYLASNLMTLGLLFAVRYALADRWLWAGKEHHTAMLGRFNYDIHGLVTVRSDARLPELERFRIDGLLDHPTVRVSLGHVGSAKHDSQASRIRYREWGPFGFGCEIADHGDRVEIVAARWLALSPHVLYTNIVEPTLRWTFVKRGYALVHGACIACDGDAYLITARTDTGKTTTILRTLDHHPHAFLSDDLTLVSPDGRVLTYPKPLTISSHTVASVKTPLLTRLQRMTLPLQSRLHSRNGRRFAMLIAKTHLPAATINGVIQALIPPPQYHVDKLIPGVAIAPEADLTGMVIIQRGGRGDVTADPQEALAILLENCEDAYGFPPYPRIESFLHSRDGLGLRDVERSIIRRAMAGRPTTIMRSETMDWHTRLPRLMDERAAARAARTAVQAPPALHLVDAPDSAEATERPAALRRFAAGQTSPPSAAEVPGR